MTHGLLFRFTKEAPYVTLTPNVERLERTADGSVSICAAGESYQIGIPGLVFGPWPDKHGDPQISVGMCESLTAAAKAAGIPVVSV